MTPPQEENATTVTTQLRLPAELHAAIVEMAERERRSRNAQMVVLLEKAVQEAQSNA